MDGIDGIAGIQAVTAGIGWLIVGNLLDVNSSAFYGGALAFASLGFLIRNWQPAKIFMGDVGSAFLGYSFAVLPLLAKNEMEMNRAGNSVYLPVIAVVVVWFFLFDTVLTFFRRVVRGEKIWQAHRSHIYQRLVQTGRTHQFVSGLYALMSITTTLCLVLWIWINEESNRFFLPLLTCLSVQSAGLLIYTYFRGEKKYFSLNRNQGKKS
jgi:UDP-N-acetylmuramyl pentapeptide phosphotransferase/UDP-N-acetylglucosamine-1-phosphate transferase